MTENPAYDQNTEQPRRWRDVLPIHPACEKLFRPMSETELRELTDDIDKNDLQELVEIYDDPEIGDCVLDGRNRLDALERLGQEVCDDTGRPLSGIFRRVGQHKNFDPYAYVVSRNLHRRHLSADDKRDVIAKLLALASAKSNRAIAATAGVSHNTVAAVRREMEATGQIDQLEKTTGKDGKERPAKRAPARTAPPAPGDVEQLPTPVEMAPLVSEPTDYDINRLRSAMREIEAQATAGNVTRLREAIEALVREGNSALKASRITLAPDHGLQ